MRNSLLWLCLLNLLGGNFNTHLRTKQEKETLSDLTYLNISPFALAISKAKATSNMTIKTVHVVTELKL